MKSKVFKVLKYIIANVISIEYILWSIIRMVFCMIGFGITKYFNDDAADWFYDKFMDVVDENMMVVSLGASMRKNNNV